MRYKPEERVETPTLRADLFSRLTAGLTVMGTAIFINLRGSCFFQKMASGL